MNFIISISREDINPINIIKKYKIILLLTVNFLIITEVFSQTPVDYFNSAKTSFEKGDIDNCMRHLDNCQNILGGSNAKIESLRFQAYYQKGNFLEAAKAFKNYDLFLSNDLKNSLAYSDLKSLNDLVWEQLNAEKKLEEERIKKEVERDLTILNEEKTSYESNKTVKNVRFIEKNANELAKIALEKKDSSLLAFYKNRFAALGIINKSVELELDKKENPIKYKRLDEIAKMTSDAYNYYKIGHNSYRNYDYYYKADSIINYLFNNYKKSEFEDFNLTKIKSIQVDVLQRYNWNKQYYEKLNKIIEYDEFVIKVEGMKGKYYQNGTYYAGFSAGLGLISFGLGGMTYLLGENGAAKILVTVGGGLIIVAGIIKLSGYISYQRYLGRMKRANAKLDKMRNEIGPVLEKRKDILNGVPLININ